MLTGSLPATLLEGQVESGCVVGIRPLLRETPENQEDHFCFLIPPQQNELPVLARHVFHRGEL